LPDSIAVHHPDLAHRRHYKKRTIVLFLIIRTASLNRTATHFM
jgi:hypothetical protein